MSKRVFEILCLITGAAFALAFAIIVVPALVETGDIPGAFAAGFVNPFAAGYSLDTILCGVLLAIFVLYERSAKGVRHGWIALPLYLVPGVAVRLAYYLILRSRSRALV